MQNQNQNTKGQQNNAGEQVDETKLSHWDHVRIIDILP